MSRRSVLALGALLSGSGGTAIAYPKRQVMVVVPYTAGGTADIVARQLCEELQKRLAVTFVVENKAGASGTLGCATVAKAAPDGATLLYTAGGPLTIGPHLMKTVPYAVARDFTPLALICQVPSFLVVNANDSAKTLRDLVAHGRSKPNALRFASPGIGTSVHMIGELFRLQAGFEAVHVPYRGGAPAMNDLLSGQVDYMFENVPQLLPQVQAGTLRALAVTSPARMASAPDVPTLTEAGVPGVEVGTWYGLLGPAALPDAIRAELTDAATEIRRNPAFAGRIGEQGAQGDLRSGTEFEAFIREDDRRWRDTIESANIRAE
ncbi:tripartite tricarboxylate transporter substrate binding protein [Bradyrhizobium manausense]|uniref:Bug family tripartite tricarboxylate transporter substrate binding protein n=1 Tax=Bradyrhizobium manausense TaxID=989370 RepID=UPI001BA6711D|nr:tripartite tricarboxylate transporter substrate binding protein [Bradyrhizobium manausense]MBR0834191.1 tripartite tricarboxylate transporter substrate binding protein [Bradyrhizobium manausense]